MFDYKHYVPILKGKRGEFPSLKAIKRKSGISPLLEAIPNLSFDFIAKSMARSWPKDNPFFADFLYCSDAPEQLGTTRAHPMTQCFRVMAAAGQSAIPVTGTGRSPEYQAAVRSIIKSQKRGVAIRLSPLDFDGENLNAALAAIVKYLEINRTNVDIIIDLESVASVKSASVTAMHRANLSLLPHIADWRTLTVASAAFPKSLAPLTKDTWNSAPRSDWLGWRSLFSRSDKPSRIPSYGDYAIAHPGLPPQGRATILAQLRYTTPDTFLIWKGHDVFKHGRKFAQFYDICRSMVSRPECRPATFSLGDSEIHEKAASRGSSGNAETWRKIGVNHHVETVLDQIANLP